MVVNATEYMRRYMRNYNKKYYYCECGSIIQWGSRYNHLKTRKHTKYRNSVKYDPDLTLNFE